MLNGVERDCGRFANHPIHRSENLRAYTIRHKPLASTFEKCLALAPNTEEPFLLLENEPELAPWARITVQNNRTTNDGYIQ